MQRRADAKAGRRARRTRKQVLTAATAATTAAAVVLTPGLATAAGTGQARLVKDIRPGADSATITDLVAIGSTVYFRAGDSLMRSNGTAAGTTVVKQFDENPADLTVVGTTLFFTADDGGGAGRELWKSDGTPAGTVLVKTIDPSSSGYYSGPRELTAVGSTLFFVVNDGTNGRELWKSDGSEVGTTLVRDVATGTTYYGAPRSSDPQHLTSIGSTLFFSADDGTNGREIWRSDGTNGGTTRVSNLPGSSSYSLRELTPVGSTLFFSMNDTTTGRELWKSDGTELGTVRVKDINTTAYYGGTYGSYPRELSAVGSTLYFSANDGVSGRELWKSDGTSAGTVMVKDIRSGGTGYNASNSNPTQIVSIGSTIYFAASSVGNGRELWRSNGTAAGTVQVKDIYPTRRSSSPQELTVVGGSLFFTADDGPHGRELWKSNGTAAGTFLVDDVAPGDDESSYYYGPRELTRAGSLLFFTAEDRVRGRELWAVPTAVAPSNRFSIARKVAEDTRAGTVTVSVTLPGPGTLVLAPRAKSPVKKVTVAVSGAGKRTVTVALTKAGMKKLRAARAAALTKGKKVGVLPVDVSLTFTPAGGTARTVNATYRVKLR